MTPSKARKVLISGASIAGPSAAYFLQKAGFEVTVVEKSDAIRSGGYAIDIRGTAIGVVEQMGILPQLKRAHLHRSPMTFFNGRGQRVASIQPEVLMGADQGTDLELPRGRLTELLYAATRDVIDYRFNDFATAMSDGADGVDVEFRSGRRERYDLVIGADGLHSKTREMTFGHEDAFTRYLGFTFALVTLPNTFGLENESAVYNRPGKTAVVMAEKGGALAYALFVQKRPLPSREDLQPENMKQSLRDTFKEDGWLLPKIMTALNEAEDIYADSMTQIKMPTWSKGRIAVIGDAAHGPSFFSGQGTSTSLVGAYCLAGNLATYPDHADAFRAYETACRAFVAENQDVAFEGIATLAPDTATKVRMRNLMIRLAPILSRLGLISPTATKAYTAMDLPTYAFAGSATRPAGS